MNFVKFNSPSTENPLTSTTNQPNNPFKTLRNPIDSSIERGANSVDEHSGLKINLSDINC